MDPNVPLSGPVLMLLIILARTDWYWTKSGEWRGFIALSVVGGVYMEMLIDKIKSE